MTTPNPDIPKIPNTPEVGMQLSFGPPQPALLFPVRLETRFFLQADGSSQLRVRVYPDKVHIDSHEPALTADELSWGQHFWEQTWRAGNDEERTKAAWRQLADRFDPPRAAWIARDLKPLNPGDRPASPVAPNHPLPKPVNFPAPATKPEAWTRAAETRVLPNMWIVLGYKDGRLVIHVKGRPIPDALTAGPSPSPTASTDEMGLDEGMKWMVDFDAAEEQGMGIRAQLTKEETDAGLDFLLALGIKDAPGDTTDWTPRLAELLNAHRYTDGLSLVLQGTPSNNTQDAPSGYSSKDPGHEMSYVAEQAAPVFRPGDGSNADVLTTAFGLANVPEVFANLPNAAIKEQLDMRHMNTALWQGTWGYFLSQMLGVPETSENPLTDDDIAWVRNHFIDYVRANGPLPVLRIGKQPYGVLPVTSLDAWRPQAGQENQANRDEVLRDYLIRLREIWRRNVQEIPRLGRSDDLNKDLAEVLSMDGLSSHYAMRHFMGRHCLENLWVFLSAEFILGLNTTWQERRQFASEHLSLWFAKQEELTGAVLKTLGVTWRPRLAKGVFSPSVATLGGALVQPEPRVAHASLAPNYIEMLLATRTLDGIHNEKLRLVGTPEWPPPSRTLLYVLLRHSMLLEYTNAASRFLINRGLLQPALRREPELVDPEGRSTQTLWELMKTNISVVGLAGEMKLGEYLLGFMPSGEPDVTREQDLKPLSDFRASLTYLKSLNVARLEQLLTGTLDLCSHRLDAWITSVATKRLSEMRKAHPTGLLFGGYGWVMNLKPAQGQSQVPPPSGEQAPVFQSANNPGFIHTPSLTQASTAAVLRSGHLAHIGNQQDGPLAIDLSSERVRLAMWLLDGVRQGQPLGALLGYRFERRLHELTLSGTIVDQYIPKLRELAPLNAGKLEDTTLPLESIAANNVVDGLALHQRWLENQQEVRHLLADHINAPPEAVNAIAMEISILGEAIDAVSDALIAESVHQVVRGNPLRATSTVESISGGEAPPPELDVVRMPRTGIGLTYRLVTLFSGEPQLPAGWASPESQLRAKAEPHLNAWVAKLLGNPANVHCVVERLESTGGTVIATKEYRLNQLLELAPLDFIYAVENGSGQQDEIEQRILYTAMRKPDGFPPGSLLRLSPNRKPDWTTTDLGYGEFSELLRAARKLITSVRGIDAGDMDLPEQNVPISVDVVDLEKRAAGAESFLRQTSDDFKRLLATSQTLNLDILRALILRSACFGVAGAVPRTAAGDSPADRETLLAQAESIQKELVSRVDEQLAELIKGFNASAKTVEDRRDFALARLRVVLGKAFVILPQFMAANAAELQKALADSAKIQDGDPLAAMIWFRRMARVREGVSQLSAMLSYSEALDTGERLGLTVAQLPYRADDRWVGLPLKNGERLSGGKLSLVVQSPTPLDVRKPLAGLLIDEWVEVVPSETETTGIALQYDQPNAAPPQSILIAVPPEMESPWTVWSLQQVLLEALDLARIRAVDSDALDEVGHYLPALYFAFNLANDTVSTDFTTLK